MTGKIREVDYKIAIRRQKGSRSKPEAVTVQAGKVWTSPLELNLVAE